jgi:hypothetical protein
MRSIIAALCMWSALIQAPAPPASAQPAPPDLRTVLARASAFVATYVKSLSSVVSEERYEQNLRRKGTPTTAEVVVTTTLVSDYLLVAVTGTSEWLPFRDVYSVDGVPIRDRSDRLLKLFIDAPADAYQQALRIRDESSRYNIGGGLRDTNVPTFALQFLSDQLRSGFAFALKGRERQAGVDTVVVEFVETASPTVILGRGGRDVPARGRYWIDPADGRILRTRLETRPNGWTNTIDVVFRHEATMGILVPDQMVEQRSGGEEVLDGRAAYTNFRRFRVDTAIQIK